MADSLGGGREELQGGAGRRLSSLFLQLRVLSVCGSHSWIGIRKIKVRDDYARQQNRISESDDKTAPYVQTNLKCNGKRKMQNA